MTTHTGSCSDPCASSLLLGTCRQVFLCEPVAGGGCQVYACTACKKLCKRRRDGRQTFYQQCNAAELDLFDGHAADGSYSSIGIGDKQPPEYAALNCKDRMALGVLQACGSDLSRHLRLH